MKNSFFFFLNLEVKISLLLGYAKISRWLNAPIPHHDPTSIDCSTALLPYFYDFTSSPPSLSLFLSFSLVSCSLVVLLS